LENKTIKSHANLVPLTISGNTGTVQLDLITPKYATELHNSFGYIIEDDKGNYYFSGYVHFIRMGWDKHSFPNITSINTDELKVIVKK